jgi:cobalt/nickel transport protein
MKKRNRFLFSILLLSLLLGGLFSYFASTSPDGLEKVAEEEGFIENIQPNTLGLVQDYSFPIANEFLSISLAGIIGIILVLSLTYLVYQCFI